MSRRDLHLLLEKYLQNQCSAEEKLMIEKFYQLLDKKELEEVYPDELDTIEQKLWDRINQDVSTQETKELSHPLKNSKRYLLLAAAIVSITLTLGYLFSTRLKNPEYLHFQASNSIVERKNNTSLPIKIQLEDESSVVLQPKSSLFYPKHFSADTREVSLKGEGFFQISKNPKRPFFVFNKNIITRVVGTSFIIKTNEQTNRTEVTVKTGKVMVSVNENKALNLKYLFNKPDNVILTPNQKTVYSADKNNFETSLASNPIPVAANHSLVAQHVFIYDDTPITEVMDQLTNTYGIQIMMQDKELGKNTFSGDISEENLYKKLEIVCHAVKAEYEITGTKIIIKPQTKPMIR